MTTTYLFCSTLKTYGYDVDRLYALLQELRDHYNEVQPYSNFNLNCSLQICIKLRYSQIKVSTQVLMQRWVGQFRDIFDQDNYHPIAVSSSLEWRDVTASFPYESPSLEASPFPKQFPFSAMVPRFD